MIDFEIMGMRLPLQLIKALESGEWVESKRLLSRVFHQKDVIMPQLYNLDGMKRETAALNSMNQDIFLGAADSVRPPGDIDPSKSIIVGDLQPESMIALDYRGNPLEPSVIFFTSADRWEMVAESFDEFWRRLTDGK